MTEFARKIWHRSEQDETLDTIFQGKLVVVQSKRGYRFSLDAVLLAHFVEISGAERIVDLGTGNGVVALILASQNPSVQVVGLELQVRMVDRASRGVILNRLKGRVEIVQGNVCSVGQNFAPQSYDIVVSNPPYRRLKSGRVNPNPERTIARHEVKAESWLGSVVALTLLRELGPVLSAFMVTGRTGSAMAAEIGTMRITEQIDALYSMAINPIKYLVSPRIVAGLIAMPLLTAIFDVVGIYGAYLIGVKLLGVSSGSYFAGMENSVVFRDVYTGFLKSLSFGLIITWICCYKGFNTSPMATGVSRATTESVVLSFIMVLVWDYFLTSVLL